MEALSEIDPEQHAMFAAVALAELEKPRGLELLPAAWISGFYGSGKSSFAKLLGLALGVPALLAFNMVRIVSLYYTGVYFPDAFEILHVDVWQPLFILIALLVWIAWTLWSLKRRAPAAAGHPAAAGSPEAA